MDPLLSTAPVRRAAVDPARVVNQGVADADPVAPSDNAADPRLDRRVEIVLR